MASRQATIRPCSIIVQAVLIAMILRDIVNVPASQKHHQSEGLVSDQPVTLWSIVAVTVLDVAEGRQQSTLPSPGQPSGEPPTWNPSKVTPKLENPLSVRHSPDAACRQHGNTTTRSCTVGEGNSASRGGRNHFGRSRFEGETQKSLKRHGRRFDRAPAIFAN